MFNNPFNFDIDYLEKVLDRTNTFTKLEAMDFKFISENNLISSPVHSTLSQTMSNNSKHSNDKNYSLSSTMPSGKKNSLQNIDKSGSCGYYLIKIIFAEYCNKILEKYTHYFEANFYDTRDFLKNEILKNENKKLFSQNSFLNTGLGFTNKILSLFIFSTFENFISVGPYFDQIESEFKLPSFVKDILQLVKKIKI
jgi:hypothetical protein